MNGRLQLVSRTLTVTALGAWLSGAVAAQCSLGAFTSPGGGAIPVSGTGDGSYPISLPTSPLVLSVTVGVLPAGAASIDSILLRGLTHSSIDDLQFVLESPSGARFNVLNRLGGFACDFGGDYRIVSPTSCYGAALSLPGSCTGSSVLPPGNYAPDFGGWPSSAHGIFNVPLESIPISTGVWTLTIYDWVASASGAIGDFDLDFDEPTTGNNPPEVPTCVSPRGTVQVSPVDITWNATRATTHKVRVVRTNPPPTLDVYSNGNLGASEALDVTLAPGEYEWFAGAANSHGEAWMSQPCTFCIAGRYCVPQIVSSPFPAPGAVDGTWPTIMPTGELTSSLAIVVPPGSTQIAAVKLNGFVHSWIADCQIVLESPSGVKYNLFQDNDGNFGGGCSNDAIGDFVIVDKLSGIQNCSNYVTAFNCMIGPNGIVAPDTYLQHHGLWQDGSAGIFNMPLSQIPVSSGTWKLLIYDWNVAADDGALDSWELCVDTGSSSPVTYCTAGTTSNGCNASISATTQPSATLATACFLNVANVDGQKVGVIFYGINGPSASTWGASTSFLCVKAPTQRTIVQNSGGAPNSCSGAFSLDWNTYQLAHPSALGNPFSAGGMVYAQAWFRDPPSPKSTNLSDALELTVQP